MTKPPGHPNAPAPQQIAVREKAVNAATPWSDDLLARAAVAERLQPAIREHETPFVIALDAPWGAGKTFLLKRWHQDLTNADCKAVYFNAWEDDLTDEPLVAVVGQLSESFTSKRGRKAILEAARAIEAIVTAMEIVEPRIGSLRRLSRTVRRAGRGGIIEKRHRASQEAADKFRDSLGQLGAESLARTGQPLIFIVDDLDRCRPSFAVSLLERIKHVCNAPDVVFVFGINLGELAKAVKVLYGDIDAERYLGRFFDASVRLPGAAEIMVAPGHGGAAVQGTRAFCEQKAREYGLPQATSRPAEMWETVRTFAYAADTLGLALREAEQGLRLIALAARSARADEADAPTAAPHPALLGFMVALKIADPDLFQRFIEGAAGGPEIGQLLPRERGCGT